MFQRIATFVFGCWLFAGAMSWSVDVPAGSLETLVMPGELAKAHAKYEERCEKCHKRFDKGHQRQLCLDCHEDVAKDVQQKVGYHGLNATIQDSECRICHREHLGRGADIVQFNRAKFDHAKTDFPLKGGHLSTACGGCHKRGELFRKATTECGVCHKRQDVHKGRLGGECGRCHSEQGWPKFEFDHSKTKYPLSGKHQDVACALCHPNERYRGVPSRCSDCHRINDVHVGKYGEDCKRCHTTEKWKVPYFDHDKTKFSLTGTHKRVSCRGCHGEFKEELGTKCFSCHEKNDSHNGVLGRQCNDCHNAESWRKHTFKHTQFKMPCFDCHQYDDEHVGRYGKACDTCHNTKTWKKASFAHDKETKFPLRGKHRDIACQSCHKAEAKREKDKTACIDCHKSDDIHEGQEGKQCQGCHSEKVWRETVNFDHDLSNFPLIGMHNVTACQECHTINDFKEAATRCIDCHKGNDVHKKAFGDRCDKCHNPNSWGFWQFDHDKQTRFKLDGEHGKLACNACHPKGVYKELSSACYSCHRVDDVHGGGFGTECGRCHETQSFTRVSIPK